MELITLNKYNNKTKIIRRKDMFSSEKEFGKYLKGHFDILEKQIIKGIGKKSFNAKFKSKASKEIK